MSYYADENVDIGTRGKAALPKEGEELTWLQKRVN